MFWRFIPGPVRRWLGRFEHVDEIVAVFDKVAKNLDSHAQRAREAADALARAARFHDGQAERSLRLLERMRKLTE